MAENTFLDKLAGKLLTDYPENLSEITVILPNRRAKVFLTEALRTQAASNMFAPRMISIEEFVQDISGIQTIDNIALLF